RDLVDARPRQPLLHELLGGDIEDLVDGLLARDRARTGRWLTRFGQTRLPNGLERERTIKHSRGLRVAAQPALMRGRRQSPQDPVANKHESEAHRVEEISLIGTHRFVPGRSLAGA